MNKKNNIESCIKLNVKNNEKINYVNKCIGI